MADPISELAGITRHVRKLSTEAQALLTIIAAGMIGPERPDRLLAMYRALDRYGPLGAAITAAAVRHGDRPAVIDELGTLTFEEMDRRSNAIANAFRARGVGPDTGVGILCRNHRGVFDASFGVLKAGGKVLYLNTDFAGPQAREVCAREGVQMLVYDEEFREVVGAVDAPKGRFLAWTDDPDHHEGDGPTLEAVIRSGNPADPPRPAAQGKAVILTSGTTGTPKGANRTQPRSLAPVAAILSRIPFRSREITYMAPPVYHAWGLGVSTLTLGLGSALVMRRRFDPEAAMIAMAEHRCSALTVVPVLLSRLVALGPDRLREFDLSALRIIASSGSQLSAALATSTLEVFGPVLYNLYGSTEVAWATIATPKDLREAPGCAGKPPLGTTVRILDDEGNPLPPGHTGRIFVGSGMEFGGYTGGGTKETVGGLMSTGDVGRFDDDGRLWVDGRDDEMIVSGGENVFPREIEEVLEAHEAVVDAAAVGTDDETLGQRLRVFVVVRDGRRLTEQEVKDHVRANLARYKVPRDVVFVDQLPRNPSGKILKRELTKMSPPE
ncbi:MAG TPA: acyl-CoA synthetase [Acidimicrobiales bacterium]|nr:acyl-CoA synthetase [Acidimicrobiales bacterium]